MSLLCSQSSVIDWGLIISCGYVDSADWGWFGILQLISCISLWEDFVIVVEFLSLSGLYDQWFMVEYFW